jgi:fucose permease
MVADERYFMIYYIVYRYLCSSKIETITLTIMNKSSKLSIIPVMLCFFAMGFVDLVGIASNYVKEDLNLNDATANLFPSLVFFWFLIFSVPTGILMNKIGRKKTVLLSLLVTVISLLLPIFGENFDDLFIIVSVIVSILLLQR